MSLGPDRSEESFCSSGREGDVRKLSHWRQMAFNIGVLLLVTMVSFYLAWTKFNRSPLCRAHTLGNECGFLLTAASLILVLFGQGKTRIFMVVLALITMYFYVGSIGIAMMDC